MRADLRISIKDYHKNKSLKVLLFRPPYPSHQPDSTTPAPLLAMPNSVAAAPRVHDRVLRMPAFPGNYVQDYMETQILPLALSLTPPFMGVSGWGAEEGNRFQRFPGLRLPCKFGWGRGGGIFSVSHSGVGAVAGYIAEQEDHHRHRSFSEELRRFVKRYGLKWHAEETVGNGFPGPRSGLTPP